MTHTMLDARSSMSAALEASPDWQNVPQSELVDGDLIYDAHTGRIRPVAERTERVGPLLTYRPAPSLAELARQYPDDVLYTYRMEGVATTSSTVRVPREELHRYFSDPAKPSPEEIHNAVCCSPQDWLLIPAGEQWDSPCLDYDVAEEADVFVHAANGTAISDEPGQ